MGLHQENTHGRVFRGLDAFKHLEMHKRDSHGDKIRMNYVPAKDKANDNVATVESIVYVTETPTFSGSIAGYVTPSAGDATSAATSSSEAQSSATPSVATSSVATPSSATPTPTTSSAVTSQSSASATATTTDDGSNNKSVFLNAPTTASSATSSATPSTTASYTGAPVVGSGGQQSGTVTAIVGSPLATTRNGEISSSDVGMTGGAKAGLAFGIILALALAGGLLFFCWRRRKNANRHEELLDEKRTSSIFGGRSITAADNDRSSAISGKVPASLRSTRTTSTAPRLSLRPVTQFLPNLTDNRRSAGNTLDLAAAMSEKPKSMWERRAHNAENPFANPAIISEKQARPESPPSNPFEEPDGRPSPGLKPFAGGNHSQKSSWDSSRPSAPNSTRFGTASAVPVVAGAAPSLTTPGGAGPNNVHRVQLDFKPSMDDELELNSGQLVRMLHEYDDGWALCTRMDRSQQGVAPRTCLSKMPVKPRQGPPPAPVGPNGPGRSTSPMMGPPPAGPRGPPQHAGNSMYPRPLTPNNSSRPQTPTNGAMPTRKPVHGVAM